jgi:hypothetical protein
MRTTLKRLLVTAACTVAGFGGAAALSAPAQASTTCHVHWAQYTDLISVKLSDNMCTNSNGTSHPTAGKPVVTTTSWYGVSGSIRPISVTDGTFFDPNRYGPPGSETAWANVVFEAYNPGGGPIGSFTIYMRLWLTPKGVFHYYAGR